MIDGSSSNTLTAACKVLNKRQQFVPIHYVENRAFVNSNTGEPRFALFELLCPNGFEAKNVYIKLKSTFRTLNPKHNMINIHRCYSVVSY